MFRRAKKRPRVLIADDDELLLELLETLFNAKGAAVIAVGDGKAALEAALAKEPDLIVLDVMMPEMSGFDVLRELRQRDATKDTPIAILTARDEESEIVGGLLLGANDYVIKETPPDELVDKIWGLLES